MMHDSATDPYSNWFRINPGACRVEERRHQGAALHQAHTTSKYLSARAVIIAGGGFGLFGVRAKREEREALRQAVSAPQTVPVGTARQSSDRIA
ncbi:hypothetical protein V7S43_007390 [Phytophthora oleae]|uniref:Uncharacterized protein n=1 Tax=Phytophthora oleae TaxID=2107226 RepID=A0ABD3FQC0_9STRA